MFIYKKSIWACLLVVLLVFAVLLSGCRTETPPTDDVIDETDNADTDIVTVPSIETEIIGTWQINAVFVHGDSRQEYISEIYLTFTSDGAVELSDNNYEEPFIYSGTFYAKDGKIYTEFTSVNQESFEVSPENMNGEITIDGDTGELVYDYINDSNGLTWYFTK